MDKQCAAQPLYSCLNNFIWMCICVWGIPVSLSNKQAQQYEELEFEVEYQQFCSQNGRQMEDKYGIKMRAYIGKLG